MYERTNLRIATETRPTRNSTIQAQGHRPGTGRACTGRLPGFLGVCLVTELSGRDAAALIHRSTVYLLGVGATILG
jgi:hypothetical protein